MRYYKLNHPQSRPFTVFPDEAVIIVPAAYKRETYPFKYELKVFGGNAVEVAAVCVSFCI
jgi:hypothetical protein